MKTSKSVRDLSAHDNQMHSRSPYSLFDPILLELYGRLNALPFVPLRVILKDGLNVVIQHPEEVERHLNYFFILPRKPDGTYKTVSARDIARIEVIPIEGA